MNDHGPASNSTVSKYDVPGLLGDRAPRRFHVMVKPGGATCNLDCAYCFYLSKETLPRGPGAGRMSDAVLEQLIRQHIAAGTGPEVVFSWQGGEPTLLGVDFFRKAVSLQKTYAKPGQAIKNDLQTNGVLIDKEWIALLKEHDFLVGLSIDGPRAIHDLYRVNKGGQPTFDRVMAALRLLQKGGVAFSTLTCVHRHNARKPLDVYRFLRDEAGSTRMQFIPIVEYKGFEATAPNRWRSDDLPRLDAPEARPGHPQSIVTDWSVDPDDYGYFLTRVFDRWVARDVGKILVNHFESLLSQHMALGSQVCIYSEFCGKGVAVEHDGGVYACDHYVYPEYQIGNVNAAELGDLVFSRTQVQFGYAKNETLPAYCKQCEFLTDCWGECPKNRIVRTPDGEPGLNYLCRGLKTFFAHAIPEVDRIAARLRASAAARRFPPAVGPL